MSTRILVVDDEPDVESMFRQHFRRDLRAGRFTIEFATSAPAALEQVGTDPDPSLILSDINMPGMSGLEMLPQGEGNPARTARHHYYGVWRRRDEEEGSRTRGGRVASQADRLRRVAPGDRAASGRVDVGLLWFEIFPRTEWAPAPKFMLVAGRLPSVGWACLLTGLQVLGFEPAELQEGSRARPRTRPTEVQPRRDP